MTVDNKESTTNSKHTSLESFFPLLKEKKFSFKQASVKTTTILIRRRSPNSDTWICNSCNWTGDKWFMEKHPCRQNIKKNFARIQQRLQNNKEL